MYSCRILVLYEEFLDEILPKVFWIMYPQTNLVKWNCAMQSKDFVGEEDGEERNPQAWKEDVFQRK